MIRQHVVPKSLQGERLFRWRGGEVSRIEALSDAVFALCFTLLIVSLEVPSNYGELIDVFVHVPVFAACSAILLMCWFFHYQFHRRYGFEDTFTILTNIFLLFVILLYVYPLKFVATSLLDPLLLGVDWEQHVPQDKWPALMRIYSSGFASIFALLAWQTYHAYRKRDALGLDRVETATTLITLRSHLIATAFGVVSLALTFVGRDWTALSGMVYFLIAPVQGIHGWRSGIAVERMWKEQGERHENVLVQEN